MLAAEHNGKLAITQNTTDNLFHPLKRHLHRFIGWFNLIHGKNRELFKTVSFKKNLINIPRSRNYRFRSLPRPRYAGCSSIVSHRDNYYFGPFKVVPLKRAKIKRAGIIEFHFLMQPTSSFTVINFLFSSSES